jgi:NAD(P)H-hydrate repair Nnr-like enzyme with NAD(P)H-hydrate dehydratase domain
MFYTERMDQSFWLRQTDKPLFPELEWSRPETRAQAGKLLIIGGNAHGFAAPAEAYGLAEKAGAGTVRVLLPESLRRSVGKLFPGAEFAPSTPSGSFASSALAELLGATMWADGVLLPGDTSRNSETTVLLEKLLEKYPGQVTLTKDVADIFVQQPLQVLQREQTLLVLAMGQLRQLGSAAHFPRAFTSEMGLVQLADNLHEFTKRFPLHIITKHQGSLVVATAGQVSTTQLAIDQPVWRLRTAAAGSVWWLQNPSKPFEALTTAAWQSSR